MQIPLEIQYHKLAPSPALDAKIRERIAKLEAICNSIIGCHVMVDAPHQHNHQGKRYAVTIRLTVPDAALVVGGGPQSPSNEDCFVATQQAFDALTRQLQRYQQQRQPGARRNSVQAAV